MASAISQTARPTLALPQGTTTAPPSGGTTTINPRTRLLLEGPIAATLLRLAPPNLVVNVILIAVTASIDAHFVGRLGAPALAGVSLVFPLMMLMQQIANSSMGSAIAASVARAVGASRRDDATALAVHGLVIAAAMVTHADGYAERDAALLMLAEKQHGRSRRITVGADKAYDYKDFVRTMRELNVTPHVAKNDRGRRSNLDRRTTRQPGYAVSLSRRWLIEKGFGWLKQTGPLRQVKLRGLEKVDWLFVFSCAAHNLSRLPRLIAQRHEARFRESCA